ncbi:hypothetical protein CSUI_009315 [Cystoisospora suis]|uniref:Uncharacterized protein n=1 Tax=Cystoisospora suis TaxID=483139 RepID=A0A2C6KH45_9APIC|nr:hypothetical protein CSUI_009315 [Cystoisospora suis]
MIPPDVDSTYCSAPHRRRPRPETRVPGFWRSRNVYGRNAAPPCAWRSGARSGVRTSTAVSFIRPCTGPSRVETRGCGFAVCQQWTGRVEAQEGILLKATSRRRRKEQPRGTRPKSWERWG